MFCALNLRIGTFNFLFQLQCLCPSIMDSNPLETQAQIKHFLYNLQLIMVAYHSQRKVINPVIFHYLLINIYYQ